MSDRKDNGSGQLPVPATSTLPSQEKVPVTGEEYGQFNERVNRAIGAMVRLMMRNENAHYRHRLVSGLDWLLPAIFGRQYRLMGDKYGLTVGFVLWAEVEDVVRERLKKDGVWQLQTDEWQSGANAILMMVLGPKPEAERDFEMMVKKDVFANRRLESVRWQGSKIELAEVELPPETREPGKGG
ncbi:MAG: toxin-activating lysine-acyltransferase [Betaproteobacteria bacterium]|nr:toxin-activating lysine-acyltransferase [Betaproteobacteria bacterium]